MRIRSIALAFVIGNGLAACTETPSDRLADRVESAANNRADVLESQATDLRNQAETLERRADRTRAMGDARADAIEAADLNVAAMSKEQRDAIVANEAAAVR